MDNNKSKKKSADPLPYIIAFAILFLIALGLLTWTLDVWYKSHQCALYPNIWCSDNWTCNTACTPSQIAQNGYNPCFGTAATGSTGLASCIFGPNAPGATVCFNTPTGPTGSTGGTACACPTGMANQVNNCFSQCVQKLSDINQATPCCCCPGQAGCPWTADNLPSVCGKYSGQCVTTS